MKKFKDDKVKGLALHYKALIMPLLSDWLNIKTSNKKYGSLSALKWDRIIDVYNFLLNDKNRFLKLNKAMHDRIESKIGIIAANRDLCKEYFLYLYNNKMPKTFKADIISKLGITVCPYCNISMTYNYEGVSFRTTLDHFHLKSDFYLFSIFLYNLVPACSDCNSGAKRQNDTIHVNPYFNDMDNLSKFEIDANFKNSFISSIETVYNHADIVKQANELQLNLNCKQNLAKDTDIVFQLNGRYNQQHPKQELLKSLKISWTDCNINEVAKLTGEVPENVYKEFCKKVKVPEDENNINNDSLSKLKRDILEQRLEWIKSESA